MLWHQVKTQVSTVACQVKINKYGYCNKHTYLTYLFCCVLIGEFGYVNRHIPWQTNDFGKQISTIIKLFDGSCFPANHENPSVIFYLFS